MALLSWAGEVEGGDGAASSPGDDLPHAWMDVGGIVVRAVVL